MNPLTKCLADIIRLRVSQEGWQWFEACILSTSAQRSPSRLLADYSTASKKLGKAFVMLNDGEKERLHAIRPSLRIDHWGVDEVARAAMLLSLNHLSEAQFTDIARQCYEFGDLREQQSWLRALSLLPYAETFLDTAIDACRTNIVPVFEAIACENPYPAGYFPDLNFNHMVLKCLFHGITLPRVMGLASRINAELIRMTRDFVSERQAAGREVPSDVEICIDPTAIMKDAL